MGWSRWGSAGPAPRARSWSATCCSGPIDGAGPFRGAAAAGRRACWRSPAGTVAAAVAGLIDRTRPGGRCAGLRHQPRRPGHDDRRRSPPTCPGSPCCRDTWSRRSPTCTATTSTTRGCATRSLACLLGPSVRRRAGTRSGGCRRHRWGWRPRRCTTRLLDASIAAGRHRRAVRPGGRAADGDHWRPAASRCWAVASVPSATACRPTASAATPSASCGPDRGPDRALTQPVSCNRPVRPFAAGGSAFLAARRARSCRLPAAPALLGPARLPPRGLLGLARCIAAGPPDVARQGRWRERSPGPGGSPGQAEVLRRGQRVLVAARTLRRPQAPAGGSSPAARAASVSSVTASTSVSLTSSGCRAVAGGRCAGPGRRGRRAA